MKCLFIRPIVDGIQRRVNAARNHAILPLRHDHRVLYRIVRMSFSPGEWPRVDTTMHGGNTGADFHLASTFR